LIYARGRVNSTAVQGSHGPCRTRATDKQFAAEHVSGLWSLAAFAAAMAIAAIMRVALPGLCSRVVSYRH
jgi:hypothetical protein